MKHHYHLTGMTCQNCVRTVQETLQAIDGIQSVTVTLEPPEAIVQMHHHVATKTMNEALAQEGNFELHMQGHGHKHEHRTTSFSDAITPGFRCSADEFEYRDLYRQCATAAAQYAQLNRINFLKIEKSTLRLSFESCFFSYSTMEFTKTSLRRRNHHGRTAVLQSTKRQNYGHPHAPGNLPILFWLSPNERPVEYGQRYRRGG